MLDVEDDVVVEPVCDGVAEYELLEVVPAVALFEVLVAEVVFEVELVVVLEVVVVIVSVLNSRTDSGTLEDAGA